MPAISQVIDALRQEPHGRYEYLAEGGQGEYLRISAFHKSID